MTPEERIAELEAQVAELQSEVRVHEMLYQFRKQMEADAAALAAMDAPPAAEPEPDPEPTAEDLATMEMRRRIDPAYFADAEALDKHLDAKVFLGNTPRPAPRPVSKSGGGLEALDQHLADKFNLGPDAA